MKIVCPDGTAEIRELLTPESETKLKTFLFINNKSRLVLKRDFVRAFLYELT